MPNPFNSPDWENPLRPTLSCAKFKSCNLLKNIFVVPGKAIKNFSSHVAINYKNKNKPYFKI